MGEEYTVLVATHYPNSIEEKHIRLPQNDSIRLEITGYNEASRRLKKVRADPVDLLILDSPLPRAGQKLFGNLLKKYEIMGVNDMLYRLENKKRSITVAHHPLSDAPQYIGELLSDMIQIFIGYQQPFKDST